MEIHTIIRNISPSSFDTLLIVIQICLIHSAGGASWVDPIVSTMKCAAEEAGRLRAMEIA